MKFNIYTKLLLILGLFATVPAQGMVQIKRYISEPTIEATQAAIPLTQTIQHLVKNPTAVPLAHRFIATEDRQIIASAILDKEEQFKASYYTFVHGQRSEYYFLQKLYTLLWQLRKKRTVTDYVFPHIAPLAKNDKDKFAEAQQKTRLLRSGILVHNMVDYRKLLFMNYALFANTTYKGSSSAFCVAKNRSEHPVPVTAIDPFKIFGYEAIYKKFEKEINELHQMYYEKSVYGNLLFIAVPKKEIKKYVYFGSNGGGKGVMKISGLGLTSDIKIIMETLRNNPEKITNTDRFEFCLIMAQKDGGMDPDTGIKIFPILSGDPVKLVELQKKEEALFAKIKAAIEEEENAKAQATAINRANTIVNHLVLPGKDAQGVAPAKTMARINNIMGHIQPQERIN